MNTEIWKDIPGYEGLYQVSNIGNVRSLDRIMENRSVKGRILKRCYSQYVIVSIGKRNRKTIHRLVAQSFLPNTDNKPQVNHKDGDKYNNNVDNLEWCTASENKLHSIYTLLHKPFNVGSLTRGKVARNAKRVVQIQEQKIINEFSSAREAEKITGVGHSHICSCARGVQKHAGGFQWEYSI